MLNIILSKDINELERGIYIFILLSLLSSNINYLIISANKIIDADIFHYISSSDKFLTSCICLIAIISEVFIAPTYYFTYLNLLIFRKKLRKFTEQKTPEK